jgi:uncharacterized membrane protein
VAVVLSPGRIAAGVAGGVALPVLAHAALGAGHGRWVALAEASLVSIVFITASLRARRRSGAAWACAAVGILMLAFALASRLPVYLPSVVLDLLLAWLFGHTLMGSKEALISRVARLEHGTALDAETLRYTRSVTLVWCLFFSACAVTSLLLGVFASPKLWSLFANVLMFPLVVALFMGEWLYRRRRFHEREHGSPLATIAKFASASAALFDSHGA